MSWRTLPDPNERTRASLHRQARLSPKPGVADNTADTMETHMTAAYANALAQTVPNIGAWRNLNFFQSSIGGFQTVLQRLNSDQRTIYPDPALVLDALRLVQPPDVKVVIFGQDPYATLGNATGHAFAIPSLAAPGPRSLRNIFCVVRATTGGLNSGQDLIHWVNQGVLLLNTVLTVPRNTPGGHASFGWQRLIKDVIRHLIARNNIYWMFWGRKARKLRPPSLPQAQFMQTSHPAARGRHNTFPRSDPFSRANSFLSGRQVSGINW